MIVRLAGLGELKVRGAHHEVEQFSDFDVSESATLFACGIVVEALAVLGLQRVLKEPMCEGFHQLGRVET